MCPGFPLTVRRKLADVKSLSSTGSIKARPDVHVIQNGTKSFTIPTVPLDCRKSVDVGPVESRCHAETRHPADC